MTKKKIGLLIMAYGTPYRKEDIVPYYTAIRHGRRPTDEEIEDLTRRYEAIGGASPLARLTMAQAETLEKRLNGDRPDLRFKASALFSLQRAILHGPGAGRSGQNRRTAD
jgi:ferrochelatase